MILPEGEPNADLIVECTADDGVRLRLVVPLRASDELLDWAKGPRTAKVELTRRPA